MTTTQPSQPISTLLDAAKERSDDFSIAIAFRLLKRKHRERPDVRDKLAELAERKAVKR